MKYTEAVELALFGLVVAVVAIDMFARRERRRVRDQTLVTTEKIIVDLRNRR